MNVCVCKISYEKNPPKNNLNIKKISLIKFKKRISLVSKICKKSYRLKNQIKKNCTKYCFK